MKKFRPLTEGEKDEIRALMKAPRSVIRVPKDVDPADVAALEESTVDLSDLIVHSNILEEANRLTAEDRNTAYGHPLDNFTQICKLWSEIAGVEITPEQHGLMMIAVKISRFLHSPKQDNLIDIAGYARTIEMVQNERKRREAKPEWTDKDEVEFKHDIPR